MSASVMQPYVFPYIGYFHLVEASDRFVFYDDVNYKTRGWIHRNRILLNGDAFLFSFPISRASQNKLINETALAVDDAWRGRFERTIAQAYRKAPFFSRVAPLVESVVREDHSGVSELAIRSIASVYAYLDLPFEFLRSSECSPETRGLDRADRLIAIAKGLGCEGYVNSPGGKDLYDKETFAAKGVELGFVESESVEYEQFSGSFVPSLSIIDALMFNEPATVREFLKAYRVV